MGKLFNLDSPLMRTLALLADLMILSTLWTVCSLPLITAGASTAALYSVTLKIARHRYPSVVRPFFKALRGSLLKGILLELFFVLFGGLIYYGLSVMKADPEAMPWFFYFFYILFGILFLIAMDWTWPLEAGFVNGIGCTLKNSLILGISHPLITISTVALNLLPLLVFLISPEMFLKTLILWLLVGAGGIALLNSRLFLKVLNPFFEGENREQEAEMEKKETSTAGITEVTAEGADDTENIK